MKDRKKKHIMISGQDELYEVISKYKSELKGVILDLRNNAGGLLGQAIAVADKFLSSGMIVVTVEPMGKQKIQKAKKII